MTMTRITGIAALVLIVLPGCSAIGVGGTPKVRLGDVEVVQVEETLQDAEREMLAAAALEPTNLAPDARCYLTFPSEDSWETTGRIRCGPVLFSDSDPGAPWILFETSARNPGDGSNGRVRLRVEQTIARSSPLPTVERLWRPDGATAPEAYELAVPLPPPLARDFLDFFSGGQSDLLIQTGLLRRPVDPELRSESGTLRIVGIFSTDAPVRLETSRLVRPPDGHLLHLFQYETDLVSTMSLGLRIDGRAVRDLPPGPRGVALVAPVGARIELHQRDMFGIEHTYDVGDGRITRSPDIYYRNTRAATQYRDTLVPQISCPDRAFRLDDFPVVMRVSGFRLGTFRTPNEAYLPADSRRLGFWWNALTADEAAVIGVSPEAALKVLETVTGGAAARAGLIKDDVIVGIDGRALPDRRLGPLLEPRDVGERVMLDVVRDGSRTQIPVVLTQWVWLVMDYEVTGGLDWMTPVPAFRWFLQLVDTPDGPLGIGAQPAEISPVSFGVYQPSTFGQEQPAWQVPVDFTRGTIRIAPGAYTKFGCSVDFGDQAFVIPVNIPR
jgi:hypothetical protein